MRFAYKRPISTNLRTLVQVVPYVSAVLYLFNMFMQAQSVWVASGAEGQSLAGYLAQSLSLGMWLAFYGYITPEQKGAFWMTAVALVGTGVVAVMVWSF